MDGKKVLVTGGAGFIGSHVVDYLVENGCDVTVIDDLSGGSLENVNPRARFIKGSLNNVELVEEAMKGIEVVYHLAAYAAEGLSHFVRRFNYENNLIASVNLINAAIRNKVETFLFTSSMAVYGKGKPPFTEDDTPSPEDPYGIAKFSVEQDLKSAKELFGMDYIIMRPHNVYGERQHIGDPYRNVIGIFMNRVMMGLPPLIYGDGSQTRAFSYIGDVAPCIAKAPFIPKSKGHIINLGSGKMYTLNELAEIVVNEMDPSVSPEHTPPRFEVQHAYCTTDKSEDLLDFEEKTPLREGIRKMALWAKNKGVVKPTIWKEYELEEKLPVFWRNLRDEYKEAWERE